MDEDILHEGTRLCSHCRRLILEEARECPYCGAEQPLDEHAPIEEGVIKTSHD